MESVLIRQALARDVEGILAVYAPYVTDTAVSFEYDVPTPEEFEIRLVSIAAKYPYLVAEENGEIIGFSYGSRFQERKAYDFDAEVSIYIQETHRRRNTGKRLYTELETLLVRQGIRNVYAKIACPAEEPDPYLNRDSILFHQACGYREAGHFHRCGFKFGRWYDLVCMEKILIP